MAVDPTAVSLAAHEIAAHPAVIGLEPVGFEADGAQLTFRLDLGFGDRWKVEGASPTGVLPVETVRLDFRPGFPRVAPRPSLRPNFDRRHPHIQPYLTAEGRVVPCLVDGPLDEFVASRGLYRLIDQFVRWLRSAAEGALIDPSQGWEPMRRDAFADTLTCDPAQLRNFVNDTGGFKILRSVYWWRRDGQDDPGIYHGEAGEPVNAKIGLAEEAPDKARKSGYGVGVVLVAWAGREPDGRLAVCDTYAPDDIHDLTGLRARAKQLHMDGSLEAALHLVERNAVQYGAETFPVPVVLMVRRPYKLIGSDSDIELCPYLVPVTLTGKKLDNPPVRFVGQYDAIAPALLARLSGEPKGEPWALLGCGSLGSKIALHRARSGAGPVACADKASLQPHNAARHGLTPRDYMLSLGWGGPKVHALQEAIQGLKQTTLAVYGDQRQLMAAFGPGKRPAPTWLVNTTASTVVREDLGGAPTDLGPRVVEACLFDGGRLGYLSVEGQARNPDTAELMGSLYEIARRDISIGERLFHGSGQIGSVGVGQGCGSLTMTVSDAQISTVAGVMAEALSTLDPKSDEGQVHVLLSTGLGTTHQMFSLAPWTRLPLEGLEGWMLSLSPEAQAAIDADIASHRRVETGGVLIGWRSTIARRIYVTSVMAAPKDSVRRAAEFTLGTHGLRASLEALAETSAHGLLCVGTWHSHLGVATPSAKDLASAKAVGLAEPFPMAFLIKGVDGLRAISAAATTVQPQQEAG